jgi:HAD superfamily hydrolase (TIGR01509 family)
MRVLERLRPRARERSSKRPEAILWDNDGVLVETEALYFRASREVLAAAGIELSRAEFVEISLRRGASCFELAEHAGFGAGEITAMRADRDRRYLELLHLGVSVLDGVRETLSQLRGRLPMAIVTSSKGEHFDAIHTNSGLLAYFEVALTAEDYERSKPDPEPYLAAARRLDVDPRVCLAVEDSERGLTSAVAAGMRCVAVPSGLASAGDLAAAWRILPTIRDLPALLDRWHTD